MKRKEHKSLRPPGKDGTHTKWDLLQLKCHLIG